MSLIRTGVFLTIIIMLLPTDDRTPAGQGAAPALAERPQVSFCERNPSTCATARDAGAVLLRKAEHGMELGARMLRERVLGHPPIEPVSARPAGPRAVSAPPAFRATPAEASERRGYPTEHHRWR